MNKIKLMYDIARVMRDKDNLDGTMKVSLMKDGREIFQLDNEFNRNFTNGWGKARISTVLNHAGKQFQHESTSEFNMDQEQKNELHGCPNRRFGHKHHLGMFDRDIKNRLSIVMTGLKALNNMQVLEQEDKSILLSLDLNEFPEDLQEAFRTCMIHRHHTRPKFLQGSPFMEKGILECRINQNYEIETITVKLAGKLQEKNQPVNHLTLDAAAVFAG